MVEKTNVEQENLAIRHGLSMGRLEEIAFDYEGVPEFEDYFTKVAKFLINLEEVRLIVAEGKMKTLAIEELAKINLELYQDILPDNYEGSYANPAFAVAKLTEDYGQMLSFLYVEMRSGIPYAFENEKDYLTILNELLIQVHSCFTGEQAPKTEEIKEIIYWFASDYCDVFLTRRIEEQIDPRHSFPIDIIKNSNLDDISYLYQYGEYISDDIIETAKHMMGLPMATIQKMADVYTEGFRIGFINNGKDLSIKKTMNIYYRLGFEKMVKQAIDNFAKMGLTATAFRAPATVITNKNYERPRLGYCGAIPNMQYHYDHRFDQGLFMDKAYINRRLDVMKNTFEDNKELASYLAGPGLIETFGEKPFTPVAKEEAVSYSDKQRELSLEADSKSAILTNQYIKPEERSFTIIAFPVPSIGKDFKAIFDETIKLNTLDANLYEEVQQTMIDTLDKGEYVHILGSGDNKTDLKVYLAELKDPAKETIFENCVADVNIPVGEVFTTPRLERTTGLLHIDKTFLDGLQYHDLELEFKDGMITDYTCKNFDNSEDNGKFILDNLLFRHPTLPMSELAIGTNTTAFVMARKYGIEEELPVLITEKMGPHFAIGDTCYSWNEDNKVYNSRNGKEIIARENTISAKRKEDPSKAYYQCHTDITIPYHDIKEIAVVTKDGERLAIIEDGRFVLPGTQVLNEPLEEL
jgi:hypothetical protein